MSSLDDPEPEDSVEIRLAGRRPDAGRSEESDGVADGARSSLLMEAVDRRGDSEDGDRPRMLFIYVITQRDGRPPHHTPGPSQYPDYLHNKSILLSQ